jgi:predicted DNA-binding transcriptional regulator YafY
LLRLIMLLESGQSLTVSHLMAELGVSRRTVFRDLNMLAEAGVPYYHEPGGGYRIARSFFLPPISLTVPETLGVMLMGKSAAAQRRGPLMAQALSAIAKLTATIPEPLRAACSDLMAAVSVNPGPHATGGDEAAHYADLQRFIDEGRVCELRYKSPVQRAAETFAVEPYALHFSARAWYLLGRSRHHREVRIFKLARIESIKPLARRFDKPANFKVADKLGAAWQLIPGEKTYRIELEFSAKVGTNVAEVRWHSSQQHELLDDGRCVMRFEIDGLGEIAWWLCGYAGEVKIRKPAALRKRVTEMHRAAVDALTT